MIHQIHNTTEMNRYPKIFEYVSNIYQDAKSILSFGCSTGEECFTLRKYFDKSKIFGVDENNDVLTSAKNNNIDTNTYFYNNTERVGNVDIIFAMSVFCKWPESSELNKNHLYSFDDFNSGIVLCNEMLNVNGLFVIYNSNYYFEDSDMFTNYQTIKFEHDSGFVKKFNKNGFEESKDSGVIFKKIQ